MGQAHGIREECSGHLIAHCQKHSRLGAKKLPRHEGRAFQHLYKEATRGRSSEGHGRTDPASSDNYDCAGEAAGKRE
jgi:hypothetical protein